FARASVHPGGEALPGRAGGAALDLGGPCVLMGRRRRRRSSGGEALRAFARELVFALDESVEPIPVGERVKRLVQQGIGDLDTAEQAKAVQQSFALEQLSRVPVVV